MENNNQENLEKHIIKYEQIKHINLVLIRKLIKLIRVFSENNLENLGKRNCDKFCYEKVIWTFLSKSTFFFPLGLSYAI